MNEITNNKVNLCDSCSQVYPDCTSQPENVYFGDGIGHDNICACSKYQPSAQPEIIRCRECKHMQKDEIFHQCWCNGNEVKLDDYCSYAERRQDA